MSSVFYVLRLSSIAVSTGLVHKSVASCCGTDSIVGRLGGSPAGCHVRGRAGKTAGAKQGPYKQRTAGGLERRARTSFPEGGLSHRPTRRPSCCSHCGEARGSKGTRRCVDEFG